jgi:hypothetical protein
MEGNVGSKSNSAKRCDDLKFQVSWELISSSDASYVSHMSYHDFDVSYVLMGNKFGRVVALYVGPHHKMSKNYVWVPKCLVTDMRGHKQIWVSKTRLKFVL